MNRVGEVWRITWSNPIDEEIMLVLQHEPDTASWVCVDLLKGSLTAVPEAELSGKCDFSEIAFLGKAGEL